MKPDNDVTAACYDNTGRLLYIVHFLSLVRMFSL